MSMTTETVIDRRLPLAGLLMVATIWFAGMGVAALEVQPEAVVAFGTPDRMISAVVGSEGYPLNAGKFYLAARAGPTTVRSLYAAGAWFVWPIIGKRCGRS